MLMELSIKTGREVKKIEVVSHLEFAEDEAKKGESGALDGHALTEGS